MSLNRIIIGVTGGSGAGKGEVCRALVEMNAQILDADDMSHEVILRGKTAAYDEIWGHFGNEVLDTKGEIDRKVLGRIVFNDSEKLAVLTKIVHKYVIQRTLEALAISSNRIIVIDAPLLVEAGVHNMCNVVVGVFAPREVRMERIMKRDGITFEAALARINSQMSDSELANHCDYIIHNNGDLEDLNAQIMDFAKVIL